MELQQQCIEQAINLHNNNPVVDAHLDLAAELVYLVRNGEMNPLRTYYLKNLRAAGVNLVVSSVYQSDRQLLEEGYEGRLVADPCAAGSDPGGSGVYGSADL